MPPDLREQGQFKALRDKHEDHKAKRWGWGLDVKTLDFLLDFLLPVQRTKLVEERPGQEQSNCQQGTLERTGRLCHAQL